MSVKKADYDPNVEYYRRWYLEAKGKIPNRAYPQLFEHMNRFREICDKAAKKGKLPDLLPEWVYEGLETRTQRSLKIWRFLRRTKDPELSEQARKRIRRAWEVLHLRVDHSEKINVLTIDLEYDLESIMVKNVLKALRRVATSHGTIMGWDKRFLSLTWDLKKEEVEEIWQRRKDWRSLVRERLTRRYKVSLERLNRLIPISRRANKSATTRVSRDVISGSMADCLVEWPPRKTRSSQ